MKKMFVWPEAIGGSGHMSNVRVAGGDRWVGHMSKKKHTPVLYSPFTRTLFPKAESASAK